MSESKTYMKLSRDEKDTLAEARDARFGEGRRITLGCYARLLAEAELEDSSE